MLPKGPYKSQQEEADILKFWLDNNYYKPEYNPETDEVMSTEEMKSDPRQPWSLICPPPNAYGRPHIGNLSGYAYQDAMARYQRMNGKKVLVLPGKDHAGLEGEGVFVREVLEKQGRKKFEMNREDFYQEMMEFNEQNMKIALKDEQDIGLSADFDRNLFTLDPKIVEIVLSTFVDMFKDGMIYKGVRIINWDPKARSVLADNQTERKSREGEIHTIKYKIEDSEDSIEVATTRPETMFGDTAVAVNPKDKRYKNLIGKKVIIPLTNRAIPIITSHRVDKDFGTGALKITPAHAMDDFIIMQEWNKENPDKQITYCNIINQRMEMVGPVPEKYKGNPYKKMKPIIIEDLEKEGFLIKTEKVEQNILISERTKAQVEPLMSSQWFVDVERLKEPIIKMVKDKKVNIHPENMEKAFYHWMENLRDWAISRSLWWGYRLPVWYAGKVEERIDDAGQVEFYIEINGNWEILDTNNEKHVKVQTESPDDSWYQDEDVLDTWFSSGQWPFATLMVEGLMDKFYPTSVMETGFDILENWVSRMMMFSWIKLKEIPFKDVYLHGLVKGNDGQKMSKSKGNLINIDEVKEKYGTDAVRMVYFYQNSAGANYSMTFEKLDTFKKFINKIWNASKFVLMNLEDLENSDLEFSVSDLKLETSRKIFEHTNQVAAQVTKNIESFDFGLATFNLYNEFWHTFCDVHLEEAKPFIYTFKNKETGEIESEPDPDEKEEMQKVLQYSLKTYLKLLHPFMPFVTERIWKEVPKDDAEHDSLMYSKWPGGNN